MQASKSKTAVSLSFSNHLIKLQSLPTIQHDIEAAAKQNGSPLDIKHPQLSLLVDGLNSSSLSTVTSCCMLLTSAVSPCRKWVEPHSLLALLITQAATTQHYTIIVDTIGKILVEEMVVVAGTREGIYQCPYSLRTNVHPFISVLNSRPESGICIVNKTVAILRENRMSLKLLEPFIKYVLLSPSSTPEVALVGNYLHSQLVSLARTLLNSRNHTSKSGDSQFGFLIVKLLLKLVPLQPVKSDTQLLAVVSMVMNLVDLRTEMNGSDLEMDLIDVCLSLVCELMNRGLPTVMLIESTVKLVSINNKLAVHHFLTISWLLLNNLLYPSIVEALMKLCKSKAPSEESSLLVFPLVQLLSQPTSALSLFGSHDLILSNQKTAATLLQLCHTTDSSQVSKVVEMMKTPSCSGQYSLLVSTAQSYASIANDPSKIILWLGSLTKNLAGCKSPSGACDHLIVILTTILLRCCNREDCHDVIKSSLNALCSIAKNDPTASPSILPFFLYLISIMTHSSSKLTLLYSVPNLATHKLSSIAVSNTIVTLGRTPSLLPIATRLIGNAWHLQDHLFPIVQEFLSRPLPSSLTETVAREVALARATVIRDICTTKAEQHGEEMLSLISVVLSSTASHDPLPVAMAIEGLVSLCNAEVIDVVTLWGVIESGSGRLSNDNRSVVVQTLCQLLELAAELDTESRHSNKSFKATALKLLWRFALTQDHHSSSAAWRALKKFDLEDFLLEYLPPQVVVQLRQGHRQDDSEQDPATTIMSGSQCVQLLQWIPLESLSDYCEFLSSLLKEEVKETGRGVVYSALREAQMTTQCERLLTSALETLPDVCAANTHRDTTPAGLINATLMSVYGRSFEDRRSQSAKRQHLNDHLKECSVKLEVFLKDTGCCSTFLTSDESTNGWIDLSCLHLGKQWRHFAEVMCDAYYQIRLLDTCSVSVKDDAASPVLQEKLAEAHIWSMDQVLGKLEEFAKTNPTSSSRVFMCLVGVASGGVGKVDQTSVGRKYSQKLGQLLYELLDCILLILGVEGKILATLPVLQTVMSTKQPDLKTLAILSLPSIVEGIWLHCWGGIGETVACKFGLLGKRLLNEIQTTSVDWYVAVVLNQILEVVLPLTSNISSVLSGLVSHANIIAASEANSLELLSIVSAFVPTFCLHANTIPVALKIISLLQEKLHSLQQSMSILSAAAQLCSLHFATGLVTMFAAGHISEDQGMACITVLAELATKAAHVGMYHLSLSIALFGLGSHGHKSAMALSDTIAAKWIQECDLEQNKDEILPLILGLAGLLGFNPVLSAPNSYGVLHTSFLKTLSPLVLSLLQKFWTHSSDMVVSSSLCLTLQVHESVANVFKVTEKAPESYNYLSDGSILNHAYSLLESLSNSLGSTDSTVYYLDAILTVFSNCDQLPPASFNKLMIPLLRCDTTLQLRCIQCFVNNKDTIGFKQLATYCCTDVVFISLQLDAQCLLLKNLPVLLHFLTFPDFSRFLQLIVGPLSSHQHSQLKWILSLLTGLQNTLKLDTLKPNYKHLIITSAKRLYEVLCTHYEKECELSIHLMEASILRSLADLLSLCGDCSDLVVLSSSRVFASNLASIIHCCWVATGVKKFNTIEGVLEWLLRNTESSGFICQFCWLQDTVHELNVNRRPQTIQLIQTDLLHMLLSWTRNNKPSVNQMKAVLILAVSSFHSKSHIHWSSKDTKILPTLEEMFAINAMPITLPDSPIIREKLCQCLLEWIHLTSDAHVHNYIIGLLAIMKSSQEYCKATVWTFIAHIL